MQNLSFDVNGMTCGGCTASVQRTLSKLDGISHAEVSLSRGVAKVLADPGRVTTAQIETAISQLGYPAQARPTTHGEKAHP